jgi:hypothetical protein
LGIKSVFPLLILLLLTLAANSQSSIDWKKDTISKDAANGRRSSYLNALRGSGQKATERVNLPVDKLKDILDACASNGITEISVLLVSMRPADVARYKANHPESGATDEQLKGTQLVVFRIPRKAFYGKMGAGINSSSSPLLLSLASSGLHLIKNKYTELSYGTDDLFFDLGTICPPPSSCD